MTYLNIPRKPLSEFVNHISTLNISVSRGYLISSFSVLNPTRGCCTDLSFCSRALLSQLRLIILLEMITNAFHNVVYPCVVVKRNYPHEYSPVPNLDIVKSNLICSKLSISAIYFRIFGPVMEHPRDATSTTPSIPVRQLEGLHQNSSNFAKQEMSHNKDVTTEVVERDHEQFKYLRTISQTFSVLK